MAGAEITCRNQPPAPRTKARVSSGRLFEFIACYGTPEMVMWCRWTPPIVQRITSVNLMCYQVFFQQSVAVLEVFSQQSMALFEALSPGNQKLNASSHMGGDRRGGSTEYGCSSGREGDGAAR